MKVIHPIPQLHLISLGLGHALIHVVEAQPECSELLTEGCDIGALWLLIVNIVVTVGVGVDLWRTTDWWRLDVTPYCVL